MSDLGGPPVALEEDSGLIHCPATIVKHQLQDLPIVDKAGRLVGIASRVDIAAAFFTTRVQQEPPQRTRPKLSLASFLPSLL